MVQDGAVFQLHSYKKVIKTFQSWSEFWINVTHLIQNITASVVAPCDQQRAVFVCRSGLFPVIRLYRSMVIRHILCHSPMWSAEGSVSSLPGRSPTSTTFATDFIKKITQHLGYFLHSCGQNWWIYTCVVWRKFSHEMWNLKVELHMKHFGGAEIKRPSTFLRPGQKHETIHFILTL